jgi:predicted RNA binding protein YcfA (HicA-like mRNA interferase family)
LKLPRDLKGEELCLLLAKYGYHSTRQTGSHIRLTSTGRGAEHHITIPNHSPLKVGTLSNVLGDVAKYLEMEKKTLIENIFKS